MFDEFGTSSRLISIMFGEYSHELKKALCYVVARLGYVVAKNYVFKLM